MNKKGNVITAIGDDLIVFGLTRESLKDLENLNSIAFRKEDMGLTKDVCFLFGEDKHKVVELIQKKFTCENAELDL